MKGKFLFWVIAGGIAIGVIAFGVFKFLKEHCGNASDKPCASPQAADSKPAPQQPIQQSAPANPDEDKDIAIQSISDRHKEAAKMMGETLGKIFDEDEEHEGFAAESEKEFDTMRDALNDLLK